MAALGIIGQFGIFEALPSIERIMVIDQGEVREAAFQALWLMDASSVPTKNPDTTPEASPA
jgi:hypothetical protein